MVNPQYISIFHQAPKALMIRTQEELAEIKMELLLADKRKVEFLSDLKNDEELSEESESEEDSDSEDENSPKRRRVAEESSDESDRESDQEDV